jgi:peroxiredoxin Q/BCP
MACTPATACCKPSLVLAPRASSRGSAARAQAALLCTPSTSAFRGLRAPASAAPAPPRWRRSAASTGIVCGKVRVIIAPPAEMACVRSGIFRDVRRWWIRISWWLIDFIVVVWVQVSKGSVPPNFTLKDQNGKPVSLNKFKGKPVVVYFYPADETPGCTKQVSFLPAQMPAVPILY